MRKLVACLWRWRLTVVFLIVLGGGLVWAVSWAREQALESAACCNFSQVALALEIYQHRYGGLPPAVLYGADGKPLHSWRLLLLEFLDGATALAEYNMQEPWDSAANSAWAGRPLGGIFHSRWQKRDPLDPEAGILAIVGPNTPWDPSYQPDENPQIIMVEIKNSGIHWMEPRDLVAADAKDGLLELLGQESALCLLSNGQTARLDRYGLHLLGGVDRYLRGATDPQKGSTSTKDFTESTDGEKDGKRPTDEQPDLGNHELHE